MADTYKRLRNDGQYDDIEWRELLHTLDANGYAVAASAANPMPVTGFPVAPQETAYTTFVAGDAATNVSVAVATPITVSVDMRLVNKYHSTLQVVTGAGTGTLAVTVQGSRDELSNLHAMTLAAPISALAASSSAVIKLDDTGLAYFHFLHFTFTATTATVPVKAVLMGRGG